MGGGLQKNIKKELAITPNSGVGAKSKALRAKGGKKTAERVRDIDLMRDRTRLEKKYPHLRSPWKGSTDGKPN